MAGETHVVCFGHGYDDYGSMGVKDGEYIAAVDPQTILALLDSEAALRQMVTRLLARLEPEFHDLEGTGLTCRKPDCENSFCVLMREARALLAATPPSKPVLPPRFIERQCSCWLGREGAMGGPSQERMACAVHGGHIERSDDARCAAVDSVRGRCALNVKHGGLHRDEYNHEFDVPPEPPRG
jgi:hypothetical protein